MQNKEERTIEKQVYGLLLESKETIFLSIQFAYSLEDAFLLAKLEFEKQNPTRRGLSNPLVGSKIGLFTIKSLEELTSSTDRQLSLIKTLPDASQEFEKIKEAAKELGILQDDIKTEKPSNESRTPEKVLSPEEEKNNLMQKIIEGKDKEMFEKNKKSFTKAEKQYLKEQLK